MWRGVLQSTEAAKQAYNLAINSAAADALRNRDSSPGEVCCGVVFRQVSAF